MTAQLVRRPRRKKLTDKMVSELPRRSATYFFPDPELPKLGVRVRPTGPGSYTVITRDPYRKQRWIKIGSTAEMKIEKAREAAREVIQRVERGLEPFPAPPVRPDSVSDVVDMYFRRHVEARGLRTGREKRRIIDLHVLPVWRHRPFAEIGRGDIARLCDAVEDGHGAWVADSVLVELSSIARWYAARHNTYQPPFVAGMKRVSGEARKRNRVFDDAEIRKVWAAAGDAGSYGALIKVLLLTGQRREKVATMRWSDITKDGTWTIPIAPREKGTPGVLRLPQAALTVINSLPRFVSNPHVFAASRGAGPIRHFAQLKADIDKTCGVKNWVLHDLRRCSRSLLSRAGVRPDIGERVLGHVQKGVEGVYDKFEYREEKADALQRLAALIETIINPPFLSVGIGLCARSC